LSDRNWNFNASAKDEASKLEATDDWMYVAISELTGLKQQKGCLFRINLDDLVNSGVLLNRNL